MMFERLDTTVGSGTESGRVEVQRFRTRAWKYARESGGRVSCQFARIIREGARATQIAYQAIMSRYNGEPIGIECRQSDRDSWAFVLPEASGGLPWRIQQFDRDGFVGHLCFDSVPEAVEAMLDMGYRTIDEGALDQVASTDRWALGVRRSAIMQRHQEGKISYAQMVDELTATV
ncbi:hypothetical protein [Burkholderia aenigmatica]|jgi:hypothetical protein|nr:hypothetical protein [Burkholderia aenigmatica]